MKFKTQDISYTTQVPTGVAGDVSRIGESNLESIFLTTNGGFPTAFGLGLQYDGSGNGQLPATGTAATAFAGVVCREVPEISNSNADDSSLGTGTPLTTQVQPLLVRGYCVVVCAAGSPVRGGTVYWQVTSHNGVLPGQFRADGTDSGNAVALTATQAEWASTGVGIDGNGNTNIAELRVAR